LVRQEKTNGGQCHGFKKPVVEQPNKFESKCEELKGYIYNSAMSNQVDLYTKTTKEIAEYASQTCKYSADICRAIRDLQWLMIDPPDEPGKEWCYTSSTGENVGEML
jgi:hypothetical protein